MSESKTECTGNVWYAAARIVLKIIFFPTIRLRFRGRDAHINAPVIFAANHPTSLDPLMIIANRQERMSALITGRMFKIPLVGWLAKKMDLIPANDGKGRQVYNIALNKLQNNTSILIFPEGYLSNSGGERKVRSGAIRLALESGRPIIPVGISANKGYIVTKKVLVNGEEEDSRFFIAGLYSITYGKPMYIKGDVNNKEFVTEQKSLLMKEISLLAQENC